MTVIEDAAAQAQPESEFDRLHREQQEAAAERIRHREAERAANEQALQGPDGIARANDPLRVERRCQRMSKYRAQSLLPVAEVSPATLEKVVGTADFLSVRYLEDGVAAARAIGRINVRSATGPSGFGTGFMVSPRLMLTNHHVLPDAVTAQRSYVEFNYQDGPGGFPLQPVPLRFAPGVFFVADAGLDFALVAVDAPAEQLTQFGYNPLTAAQGTVTIGEPVTIVQHPGGERKQIVLRENKTIDIPELHVHYEADTQPGSSGSPVFNNQWEVIALHHASVATPTNPTYKFVNEGVRISRILHFLAQAQLAPDLRAIVDTDLPVHTSPEPVRPSAVTLPKPESMTAMSIEIRYDGTIVRAIGTPKPDVAPAVEAQRTDYSGRGGYDPQFLGPTLPLPSPGPGVVLSPELKYLHFSVRMNTARRLAAYTAVNIQGPITRIERERDRWILDPRLPADQQTGEAVYRDNPLDRGHLVRRLDPAWGPDAETANADTFHFTNCAPQHHDFNAGATTWLGLEDYVLTNADNHRLAVSVLTGPVLADDDPPYRGVLLPRQYWKVVSMIKADGTLSCTGYLLSQAALLDSVVSREAFSFSAYRTFQVPVATIAQLTGLDLASYTAADPLERLEALALPREILRAADLAL
ncbi:endonuclease [Mycobacterium sp. djl-10]|nr:endonuclease [Mycobacterium sp. djl-10]